MKMLKDFPLDEWIQTADKPSLQTLHWLYIIKITWMDQTGTYGTALIKSSLGEEKDRSTDIGWELSSRETPIMLNEKQKLLFKGKLYRPIIARATVTLCLNCEKLVVKPHVFSVNNGEGELHFCDVCTQEMEAPT